VNLDPDLVHALAFLGLARRHRTPSLFRRLRDDRVHLDLDQPVGADETGNRKRGVGGTNFAEDLAVNAAYRLEIVDVDKINPRADDVLQACAGFLERRFDRLEDGAGLRLRIAHRHGFAARSSRGAADEDKIADTNRAGITD